MYVGASGRSTACGHYHDTVGTCRTIYGTGRGILKDVDAYNVARGDGCQRVDRGLSVRSAHPVETLDGVGSAHGHTVYNIKGLVGGVERTCTTDTDGGRTAGGTGVGCYLHTGHLALQHLVGVGHYGLTHLVLGQRSHGTGHVRTLLRTVTHNHYLAQCGGVLLKTDGHVGLALQVVGLGGHAHIRHHELCLVALYIDFELTVDVGSRAVTGYALLHHGGAYHRLAGVVDDRSLHRYLCHCRTCAATENQRHQRACHTFENRSH